MLERILGPAALFVAFVLTLGVYTVLQLESAGVTGPIDELLLILGGAVAGATVPRRTQP